MFLFRKCAPPVKLGLRLQSGCVWCIILLCSFLLILSSIFEIRALRVEISGLLRTQKSPNLSPSDVVVVVIAIPNGYEGIAAESHRAYCERHGYRLVVQRTYLGNATRGHDLRAVSLQKMLACSVARGEKYVLVLDYDIVIAPWAPPIHIDSAVMQLGTRVGIIDEDQPSREAVTTVLFHRTGRFRTPTLYYRNMGHRDLNLEHGILNSGVLLLQPKHHSDWFERLYYEHLDRQLSSISRFHYEQALIGAELIRSGRYALLHHAWNRNWMWYNWSEAVGGPRYELETVFRSSYFLHFLWAKKDISRLEYCMADKGLTFSPQPYPKSVDLLPRATINC